MNNQCFLERSGNHLTEKLISYYNSGNYHKDLEEKAYKAQEYLRKLPFSKEKKAIILDIDETALHTKWDLIKPNLAYNPSTIREWIQKGSCQAVLPILALYKQALRQGLDVFFVTGRLQITKEATEKNLKKVGYTHWEEIIFKPIYTLNKQFVFSCASSYKIAARWSIERRGYKIVLNIGDQKSDLSGGFAEKTIKLVNPFYTIV